MTTKVNDKTLFLVEAKQAGLFEIRNVPEEQMQPIIAIACPQIVYPYLRATVADVINRTGFPPVHLTEVNFQAMYEAQLQQAAAARSRLSGWAPSSPFWSRAGHGAGHQRRAAPPRGAAVGPRRRTGRRHAGGALQHALPARRTVS